MFPIIFQYKFIQIGGYGVMLGIGFYLSFLLFERELKLRGMNPELAYRILLAAIPAGIVGSKIFHILEHLNEFMANPFDMIFSGAGLSAYGGFIMAFILSYIIIKKSGENMMSVYDAVSPALALGYCFGRFGCHVAGDGCYGDVCSSTIICSITGTAYPNGIVPSSSIVYPTPLFEVFFSFIVLGLLLQLRKKELPVGVIFFVYLILNGLPRFLVEFIRTNPKMLLGLSQAQLVGIGFMIWGIIGLIRIYKKQKPQSA